MKSHHPAILSPFSYNVVQNLLHWDQFFGCLIWDAFIGPILRSTLESNLFPERLMIIPPLSNLVEPPHPMWLVSTYWSHIQQLNSSQPRKNMQNGWVNSSNITIHGNDTRCNRCWNSIGHVMAILFHFATNHVASPAPCTEHYCISHESLHIRAP